MRPKELQCVITFNSTTEAMAFEEASKDFKLSGRLIPVPTVITAGCGLAWRESPNNRVMIEKVLEQLKTGYNKIYEIEI